MNKLFKKLLITLLLVEVSVCIKAQDIIEELVEQSMTEESYINEISFEELAEYMISPLNINKATKEDLECFPFLSDKLIENILYYLYKYGPMLTDKELMMVEGMDKQIMDKLKKFITFKQPIKEEKPLKFKQIMKYGKHELITRMDIPFYIREGFKKHDNKRLKENPNKQYIGYPYHHSLRYNFHYGNRIYVGLTAENDAGEPFFCGGNKKGYDYYSPYLFIRNIKRIKTLVVGNFRANYGYGLVMNTDFGLGKTATINTLFNRNTGLKKHSSTDEYNYFQGISSSINLSNRWNIDMMYSYRNMDGTIDDTFITSLKKDGLHRLPKEYEKKNTFHNQVIGSHLDYNGKYYKLGLTTIYNVFDKNLNPTYRVYNKFYPRGYYFWNTSVNYKFFIGKFTLMGETAIDKKEKIATLNILRYSPSLKTQIVVMNRYYDMKYQSIYARSINEGGNVQNESAFYIGIEMSPLRYISLSSYADIFYFPWKKYLISKNGTRGFDGLFQINYSPNYSLNMFIKYRYKNKAKDYIENKSERKIIPYIQHRIRYQLNYKGNEQCLFKTIAEYNQANYQNYKPIQGYLISESIEYSIKKLPLQISMASSWFNTDDYSTRIYLYEKGPLYTFSIPAFYDKGIRTILNIRYECKKYLLLQLKYGWTHYFGKDVIGSGIDEIKGSNKQDLYLQLRWKF